MAPKKTTTPITDAQLKALIAQGVADALAEIEANRSRNGDDSHDSRTGIRRQTHVARECTYSDFLKCQPLNFKGIEGVAGLTQWIEKMESRRDQKARDRNMKPKGQGNRRYELHTTLPGIGTDVGKNVSRGKIRTFTERQAKNKRKLDNDNQAQRQPPKRQNVARAYSTGSSEKKEYVGTLPLCNKCKFHHNGPCTLKYVKYKRNQNHGNQAEGTEARGMVYALGGGETNQDLDDMEDDINY
ncbi:hypothetical protein Tco_0073603 [Tanacetum coccineum]